MEQMEELIEKSRAGDRQAQETLVRAVQDRVYYHCYKMLRNPEDARDATQEILISMLSGLGGLRQPAAFRGWLNRLTSNVCFRWISRGRREALLWEDLADSAPLAVYENFDDQTVPDKALDNEESRRMVVELVESLPEAQRLSVLFYYYDEMSVKEIAEAMETTENTVKSRLHYARKAIRKGVERYTAQGIKLYGFTPVPFLRYFLQQETASTAAAIAGRAALAAPALSAAGDAAVTAEMTKTLGGVLTRKGAAALAGLTLAGAITGGTLLRMNRPEEAEPLRPAPLAEVVPYAEPEPPAETAPPAPPPVSELPPAPAEPARTPPAWMGSAAAPEETGEPPLQETGQATEEKGPPEPPLDIPADSGDSAGGETENTEPRETGLAPDGGERNDRTPGQDDGDGGGGGENGNNGGGNGGDSPAPGPEPPAVPVPPAVSVQYRPNPDFLGDYLGETGDGVHEFLYTARLPDQSRDQFPLLTGNFFSRLEIANPMVVRSEGAYIYGVDEGETDVRYYVSETEEGPYALKALVHVKVMRQPIEPNEGYQIAVSPDPKEVPLLTRRFCADGKDQPQPLVFKGCEMKLESGNPAVLGVRPETNCFYGIAPGTAEGLVYLRVNSNFPWDLAARVIFEVEPVSESTELCRPREDFSPESGAEGAREAAYQGLNDQGLYDFTVTVREGDVFRLQPFLDGGSAVEWDITRAVIDAENLSEHTFRAMEAGHTDVIYRACPEGGSAFSPCAVVHVRVRPRHPPYAPNPEFGECLGRDEADVWHFRAELLTGGPSLPDALAKGNYYLRIVSADPGTAAVRDGRLYGVTPGSVEVRYYVSETEDTGYILQAVAQVEVKAPEPEPPEEESLIPPGAEVIQQDAGDFGYCNGYGYSDVFAYAWEWLREEQLPSGLEYRSSDPKVAVINEAGKFTTLSAGTVVLAAWDPGDPSVCYTLNFQVEDHFDWNVYIGALEDVPVGAETDAYLDGYTINYASKLVGIEWSSSDPDILAVAPIKDRMLMCHLSGCAPGTATVTGTVRFSLVTAADQLVEMTDTVSFQVNVIP